MEENTNLTLFEGRQLKSYCSINPKTEEEKKQLFNALEQCDILLNDIVGQDIMIKDIFCEEREYTDEETGELKTKYRTIIFDETGKTYATAAYGIYNVLNKIIAIYGLPENWSKPLSVKVIKRQTKNGKSTLTLTLN